MFLTHVFLKHVALGCVNVCLARQGMCLAIPSFYLRSCWDEKLTCWILGKVKGKIGKISAKPGFCSRHSWILGIKLVRFYNNLEVVDSYRSGLRPAAVWAATALICRAKAIPITSHSSTTRRKRNCLCTAVMLYRYRRKLPSRRRLGVALRKLLTDLS